MREIDPTLEAGYTPPIHESLHTNGGSAGSAARLCDVKNGMRSEVESITDGNRTKEVCFIVKRISTQSVVFSRPFQGTLL